MIKYNENDMGCTSCMGHGRCTDWKREVSSNKISPAWCMPEGRYYANKTQAEDLLTYWNYFRGRRSAPKPPTNEMKNVEFRKGDKVFDLSKGNGIVDKINKADSPYEVIVYFGSGVIESYTADGLHITRDKNRMLYHGHDLEVIVKEKPPVRKQTYWIYLYVHNNNAEASSLYSTQTECFGGMKAAQGEGYGIIKEPFKIEI